MKATPSIADETKVNAFQKIHAELKDILKHEKCRSCACLYADVLSCVFEKLKAFRNGEPDHRLIVIENDFERWVREADVLKMHG